MDASVPAPSLVGKAFVKQYYTQMHRDPFQLHRFYLEQSSFVHGGSDIGSEDPVIGQKSIHDKIKSLDLRQVHAKIKQVDSHATLGNGIVVQVTGELSTGGRPMRAFVQTFVLAPESPKKYYVHNDIFRYQDDDLTESETNEPPSEGEAPTLMDPVEDNGEYSSSGGVNMDGTKLGGGGESDGGMFSNTVAPTTDQGLQNEVHDTGGNWEHTYNEETAHIRQNGLPEDMESPATTEDYSVEASSHVTNTVDQPEVPLVSGEGFSSQDVSKENMSWAGRLSKVSGSSQNRPLNSTTVSSSQALPQREPRRRPDFSRGPVPTSNHTSGTSKDSTKKMSSGLHSRDAPDNWQIFVGGLPPQANEAEIREVFGKYDSISEIRVNPKNFAFVVFNGPEPVEKIMQLKETFEIRGKPLNIEPKRASNRGAGGFRVGDRNKTFGGSGGGMGGKGRGGGGGGGKGSKR